jgi:hypothetical protein
VHLLHAPTLARAGGLLPQRRFTRTIKPSANQKWSPSQPLDADAIILPASPASPTTTSLAPPFGLPPPVLSKPAQRDTAPRPARLPRLTAAQALAQFSACVAGPALLFTMSIAFAAGLDVARFATSLHTHRLGGLRLSDPSGTLPLSREKKKKKKVRLGQ